MSKGKGSCLCGAVGFIANFMKDSVEACHCGMCRKWGGGPLLCVEGGADVKFEGAENIGIYDSSEWAERGFCKRCGTHLFYRLKGVNEYQIPVGLLDEQNNLHFDLQVFTDQKPEYYDFTNKTTEMTEAQVIEKYAPK